MQPVCTRVPVKTTWWTIRKLDWIGFEKQFQQWPLMVTMAFWQEPEGVRKLDVNWIWKTISTMTSYGHNGLLTGNGRCQKIRCELDLKNNFFSDLLWWQWTSDRNRKSLSIFRGSLRMERITSGFVFHNRLSVWSCVSVKLHFVTGKLEIYKATDSCKDYQKRNEFLWLRVQQSTVT